MGAAAERLAQNGFAFIAFLVVAFVFISRVLQMQDRSARDVGKSMRDIVQEIHSLVTQQRADSDRQQDALQRHDERSEQRHAAMMQGLADHHRIASSLAEQMEQREHSAKPKREG